LSSFWAIRGFIEGVCRKKNTEFSNSCHQLAHYILFQPYCPLNTAMKPHLMQRQFLVTWQRIERDCYDIPRPYKNLDINIIENVTTQCESAPNWGSSLFTAKALFQYHRKWINNVKVGIEIFTDDLMVEN